MFFFFFFLDREGWIEQSASLCECVSKSGGEVALNFFLSFFILSRKKKSPVEQSFIKMQKIKNYIVFFSRPFCGVERKKGGGKEKVNRRKSSLS